MCLIRPIIAFRFTAGARVIKCISILRNDRDIRFILEFSDLTELAENEEIYSLSQHSPGVL